MNLPAYSSRRTFLQSTGLGLGATALGSLMNQEAISAEKKLIGLPNLPHFKPTAKRVIYLFMSGGPSHIDLFDGKESIQKQHGKPLPDSVRGTQRLTGMTAGQKNFTVCGPIKPMKQRGKSGTLVSDLLPHTAKMADELTVIRSMETEAINHDPGITYINTGSQIPGRPSMGAWASYGLGSENENMPAYIVMLSQGTGKNPGQPIFSRLWGSGFLPSSHQGVQLRSSGDPVLFLKNPAGISRENRREITR